MADDKCAFCGKGKDEYPKCAFCKDNTEEAPAEIKAKVEKKDTDLLLKQKAPEIYTLVQKADVTLKQKNLDSHRARVALCLDISGSMNRLYSSGKVQKLAEKTLALACRFDDNQSVDIFLFGTHAHDAGAMNIDNFKGFVKGITKNYPLEGGTHYGRAMEMIRRFYFPDARGLARNAPAMADLPVYVMFITDGETHDRPQTENQIRWAAYEPIFWQFMGLGESRKDVSSKGFKGFLSRMGKADFGFLEELDEMPGRFVDNAGFFSVKDPAQISDEELYELMMDEYPEWLKLVRDKGLLH